MGRKPKDPRNAGVSGEGSIHLGLRFGPERAKALARIVEAQNRKARDANLRGVVVTASSLVVTVINDFIDDEIAKLDAEEKKRRK
jgi:hypothetical protein